MATAAGTTTGSIAPINGASAQGGVSDVLDVGKITRTLQAKVLDELVHACERKREAAGAFKDACEIQAGKAGVHPAVLKRYIVARADGKVEEQASRARQLALLFEEL